MKTKLKVSLIWLTALSVVIFTSYQACCRYQDIVFKKMLLEKRKTAWVDLETKLKQRALSFKGTVGLVIKDLDTGWQIDLNQGRLMPAASLVKIPIMLAFFYADSEGKISLKRELYLKSNDKVAGSKVLGNLPTGSRFTVEELFNPMITQSDNAAANALISLMGFDKLNDYFKRMGLKNTNLARKMMDFSRRRSGVENYTTAADCAYLLDQLYAGNFLSEDVSRRCLEILGGQKINDRIPRKLPKASVFVAHKTGLERHICHDVGIVFTPKGDFLICVLVKHGDKTARNAKKLIADIALLTYNYYCNN
ncbi:MAG: class A beta-lactamase-related serine hydrolase [Candidatus Omnitrophica bacterium]|jgi:beta-lactamase class A|nr:class A beta-lactamase-related serine hydrolase [Candidatus Omnitrophota bacterium]